jgi:hypothetical protein
VGVRLWTYRRLVPEGPHRRAGRHIRLFAKGATPAHHDLRNRVLALSALSLVVDVIGTVVIFLFERHTPATGIETLGDSAFWTTTQLLTVSSQLPNPLSTGGRIFDSFLQLYAIVVVASLAGSFASFFHRQTEERHGRPRTQ